MGFPAFRRGPCPGNHNPDTAPSPGVQVGDQTGFPVLDLFKNNTEGFFNHGYRTIKILVVAFFEISVDEAKTR